MGKVEEKLFIVTKLTRVHPFARHYRGDTVGIVRIVPMRSVASGHSDRVQPTSLSVKSLTGHHHPNPVNAVALVGRGSIFATDMHSLNVLTFWKQSACCPPLRQPWYPS